MTYLLIGVVLIAVAWFGWTTMRASIGINIGLKYLRQCSKLNGFEISEEFLLLLSVIHHREAKSEASSDQEFQVLFVEKLKGAFDHIKKWKRGHSEAFEGWPPHLLTLWESHLGPLKKSA